MMNLDEAAADHQASPWLTVREAAARAKVRVNVIYDAIHAGKLRAIRASAQKNIRIHVDWLDGWLHAATLVNPDAPGDDVPPPLSFSGRKTRS